MIRPPIRTFNDPVSEALSLAGVIKTAKANETNVELVEVRTNLTRHGASLDDAAMALAAALDDKGSRLSAAKLAFQLHGVLKDETPQNIPQIVINIMNTDSSRTLLQFVSPNQDPEEVLAE